MKRLIAITLMLGSSICSAQELLLACDVKTRLETSGVGVREERKKITLRIDLKTGVVDGGIAGTLSRLDEFAPKASDDKFTGVGRGRVDKNLEMIVSLGTYEVNRYTGFYTASIGLFAYGKSQQQDESGQCSQAERKF